MATAAPAVAPEPAAPPGDLLYEVIDGRVVEKPPMSAYEISLASILTELLTPYLLRERRGRLHTEMLFDLSPAVARRRRPDLAYVSFERWPRDRPVPEEEAWAIIPDLAIEIVSRTNTADHVVEKVDDYFAAGVRRVWVIYPRQARIYDHESPTRIAGLNRGDTLDGGAVLPGLRLPLAELFGVGEAPAAG